jgi:hypothetical protein
MRLYDLLAKKKQHFTYHNTVLILLLCFTGLSRFPAKDGEDIVNARENLASIEPIDFWGGTSSLIYGYFPNVYFDWRTLLVGFQLIAVYVGLRMLGLQLDSKLKKWLFLPMCYLFFVFGAQTTRDGLLFSFVILALGFMGKALQTSQRLHMYFGIVCLILGSSLRPWMALGFSPFLAYYLFRFGLPKVRVVLAILGLVVTPIALDQSSVAFLELKPSYPQQQVMIMDLTSSYCWSNNASTSANSLIALTQFTSDESFGENICNLYRADTWVSLTKSIYPSSSHIDDPDFFLIPPEDEESYSIVEGIWLQNIVSDPITYLQNKLTFMSKLLVGSDTRGFRYFAEVNVFKKSQGLYFFVYDLVITLHLISIGALYLMILLLMYFRKIPHKNRDFQITTEMIICLIGASIWLFLSSIAYIGSNGRYTYTITLLSMAFLMKEEKS